jgi:hypothetical protein
MVVAANDPHVTLRREIGVDRSASAGISVFQRRASSRRGECGNPAPLSNPLRQKKQVFPTRLRTEAAS